MLINVAPLVGAWIEIMWKMLEETGYPVAPLVGAWIEIRSASHTICVVSSLPSWERGLKLEQPRYYIP